MSSEAPKKRKTADLLTMCLKARKAVKGFDSAGEEVRAGRAFCLLVAADASDKTVKEAEFLCSKAGMPVLRTELTKAETGALCGKETAVIAVCDKGFAGGFAKIIT